MPQEHSTQNRVMRALAVLFEKRSVTVVPEGAFRNTMLNSATPSGLLITPDNALNSTSVFQAIRFLSFMVASLSRITYQKKGESRQRAVWHPAYDILHSTPNEEMTSFDIWALMASHVFGRGNAFSELVFDQTGQLTKQYPLNPASMELVRNENNELRYLYKLPKAFNYEKRVLLPEQVLHLRGLTKDGLWGLSVFAMHRNAIGLSKATEDFGSAYFGNGAEPGVVLRHPGTLNEEVHNRIKTSWEQAHMGLDNAHRAAILEEGMEIEKIGFNPDDSQFLETRKFQVIEIARMFGIPPHLLFELTNATFTNIEHQSLEFVIYHLRPWLVNFEQQILRSVFLERERKAGYYTEFLVDSIVRGDITTRFASYSVGLQNGIYSINDVLKMENRNTIGKAGDSRFVPLNMAVLGEDGRPVQSQPKADPAPKEPNTPASNTNRELFIKPILLDAADRISRRENNEVTNATKKWRERDERFDAWCEQFYKRDFPEFIQTVLKPLVASNFITAERMQTFIQAYCETRGAQTFYQQPLSFDLEKIASDLLAGETHE